MQEAKAGSLLTRAAGIPSSRAASRYFTALSCRWALRSTERVEASGIEIQFGARRPEPDGAIEIVQSGLGRSMTVDQFRQIRQTAIVKRGLQQWVQLDRFGQRGAGLRRFAMFDQAAAEIVVDGGRAIAGVDRPAIPCQGIGELMPPGPAIGDGKSEESAGRACCGRLEIAAGAGEIPFLRKRSAAAGEQPRSRRGVVRGPT